MVNPFSSYKLECFTRDSNIHKYELFFHENEYPCQKKRNNLFIKAINNSTLKFITVVTILQLTLPLT